MFSIRSRPAAVFALNGANDFCEVSIGTGPTAVPAGLSSATPFFHRNALFYFGVRVFRGVGNVRAAAHPVAKTGRKRHALSGGGERQNNREIFHTVIRNPAAPSGRSKCASNDNSSHSFRCLTNGFVPVKPWTPPFSRRLNLIPARR